MHGSLTLRAGVLWVVRSVRRAHVRPFDLDGRALGPGFTFTGPNGSSADVRGIAVDEDQRLWIADAASPSVRIFSAFGVEIGEIGSRADPTADHAGALGDCSGIAAAGVEADLRILVSRRGVRRHALMLLDPENDARISLRPNGDPQGTFENLAGVALAGRLAFACEAGARAVQVFRDGEHHYRMVRTGPRGTPLLEPRAVAALPDGRCVVACGGSGSSAVLAFDTGGTLVRVLAEEGDGDGSVDDPLAVAVEAGETERASRVAVLDRGGDRVQVFTLEGRCYGSFVELDAGGSALCVAERDRQRVLGRSRQGDRPGAR